MSLSKFSTLMVVVFHSNRLIFKRSIQAVIGISMQTSNVVNIGTGADELIAFLTDVKQPICQRIVDQIYGDNTIIPVLAEAMADIVAGNANMTLTGATIDGQPLRLSFFDRWLCLLPRACRTILRHSLVFWSYGEGGRLQGLPLCPLERQ